MQAWEEKALERLAGKAEGRLEGKAESVIELLEELARCRKSCGEKFWKKRIRRF